MFEGKMFVRTPFFTFYHIFCKFLLNSKVIFLNIMNPDDTLTHSYLEISLTSVNCDKLHLENNLRVRLKLAKYLQRSYRLSSEEGLPFKYFLKINFVKEISLK